MTKRTCRAWLVTLGVALMAALTACHSLGSEESFGYSMGGIDHLADNLSVTDFWVNGAAGFQAGSGNAGVPAPLLPVKWHSGLTVHVVWDVRDWQHDKGSTHEADVPVDPYTEDGGNLWVHFLANGSVRVVVSDISPLASNYPGPRDSIPRKRPWDMYPPRHDWRDWNGQLLDDRLIKQRCMNESDEKSCQDQAEKKVLDDDREDARHYLPRCAPLAGEDYWACDRQAEQSMRAARFARRCQITPGLPECTTRPSAQHIPEAATKDK